MGKPKSIGIMAISVSCECGAECVGQTSDSTMICSDDKAATCTECGAIYSIDPALFEMNILISRREIQRPLKSIAG